MVNHIVNLSLFLKYIVFQDGKISGFEKITDNYPNAIFFWTESARVHNLLSNVAKPNVKKFLSIFSRGLVAISILSSTSAFAQLVDQNISVVPHGSVTNAGWALTRLNDGSSTAGVAYVYPETQAKVRLYLIDSAIANPSNWFDSNPNLSFGPAELIGGVNDPTTSSAFIHGTRMLSVIAGPETGAALGTPIEVVSYDVYPNGEGSSSNLTLMASAVSNAEVHHLLNPGVPGIICIANGSSTPASDPLLEYYINSAVQSGLTVIVSAGNSQANAANYVPSAYGTKDGIICVGASNTNNTRLWSSNYGASVDFYAPGEDVQALRYANPASGQYDLMTGTSPATALAAATALTQLSLNPGFTPAELEASLEDLAYNNSTVSLIQVPIGDSDGDGAHDLLEAFMGSDPQDILDQPDGPTIHGSGSSAQIEFSIDASRFDSSNPSSLTDGTTWKVLCSQDLTTWTDATGSFTYGTAADSKIPVTFTTSTTDDACFLRLQITPAP